MKGNQHVSLANNEWLHRKSESMYWKMIEGISERHSNARDDFFRRRRILPDRISNVIECVNNVNISVVVDIEKWRKQCNRRDDHYWRISMMNDRFELIWYCGERERFEKVRWRILKDGRWRYRANEENRDEIRFSREKLHTNIAKDPAEKDDKWRIVQERKKGHTSSRISTCWK